jgi:hypothetical protein
MTNIHLYYRMHLACVFTHFRYFYILKNILTFVHNAENIIFILLNSMIDMTYQYIQYINFADILK